MKYRSTFSSVPPRIWVPHFFLMLTFTLFAISGCSGGSGNSGGGTKSPAPAVTSVSPSSLPACSTAFTLNVTGSSFQPQAVVSWNATALATTYIGSSSLSAAVPANLAATGSIANITVTIRTAKPLLAARHRRSRLRIHCLRLLQLVLSRSTLAHRTRLSLSRARTSSHPRW